MLTLGQRRRSGSPMVVFFVADRVSASSRLRALQYADLLVLDGIRTRICATRPSKYLQHPAWLSRASWVRLPYLVLGSVWIILQRLVQILFAVPGASVVFVQKDLLFRSRLTILERLLFAAARQTRARVVFDIDDAIYLGTSQHALPHMQAKISAIASRSTAVLAGSAPIESRVRTDCAEVWHQPTCIRVGRPPARSYTLAGDALRVAWTGTPTNVCHLDAITGALSQVRDRTGLRVEVVTRLADLPTGVLDGLDVRFTEWSEERELDVLQHADVALAPLGRSAWTEAKCGGRILAYFRAGIPVVASAVGAQQHLVRHGVTGLVPATIDDWRSCLLALHQSEMLRSRLGRAGRALVETERSVERIYPCWRDRVLGSAN